MIETQVTTKSKPGSSLFKGKVPVFVMLLLSPLLFSKSFEAGIASAGGAKITGTDHRSDETIYVTEKSLVYNFSDKSALTVTEAKKQDAAEKLPVPIAEKNNKVSFHSTSSSAKSRPFPKKQLGLKMNSRQSDAFLGTGSSAPSAVAGTPFQIKLVSVLNEMAQGTHVFRLQKQKTKSLAVIRDPKLLHPVFSIRPPPHIGSV